MLRSVVTLKDDCAIKIKEMFIVLSLISISVTIALAFLLLSITAIKPSIMINILCYFPGLFSLILLFKYCISFEY